jgi:dipeptidyl aminopeptidase/acylaminoacyl peptidase
MLVGALVLAAAFAGASDGMTPYQVSQLQSVVDAEVSPDGKRVAVVRQVPRTLLEDEDGSAWRELWVASASGNVQPFVTGEVSVRDVGWRPDGSAITFRAKRGDDDHTGLYEIPITGGEARRLVALDTAVRGYAWHPDGITVAVTAEAPASERAEELEEHGFTQRIYEEDWRPVQVWLVDTSRRSSEPELLELPGSAYNLSFSPDGARLAVALAPTPLVDDRYMRRRIHIVDVAKRTVIGEVDHAGKLAAPLAWSDGSSRLAFIAGVDIHDPSTSSLFVVDAAGGEPVNWTPGLAGEVADVAWQGADTVAALVDVGVRTDLYTVKQPGELEAVGWMDRDPVFRGMSLAVDGRTVALVGSTPSHPSEAYLARLGERAPQRLTDSNPWLADVELAPQRVVRWEARDGLELEGLLIEPLDHEAGTRVPLVMLVHGGPEAHRRHGWLTSYSRPGQVLAARGFAVLYPNYRGSTGRGVEFSKLGQEDAAGAEFDDLVDGVDHLIAAGLVDPDRVGVSGGSYGGYATAWLATRYSERFAAGVMFVGISNVISKTFTTDIPEEEYLVHALERPWDDWQGYLERSPIYWSGESETPLLILHGEADPRVSVTQSEEMYRALKIHGNTPVRLVLYPGEGHGNRRAASRYDVMLRLLRWMEHYLMPADEGEERAEIPEYGLEYRAEGTGFPADEGATVTGGVATTR